MLSLFMMIYWDYCISPQAWSVELSELPTEMLGFITNSAYFGKIEKYNTSNIATINNILFFPWKFLSLRYKILLTVMQGKITL